ncbi:MAG: hypothetical protein J6Z04_05480 [Clostridia bacterium]|nr:hypothetical protein [Clostridia bacterium]
MHSIHAYPAKFPAFIARKAFSYAEEEGVKIESVADIFCGCGTVALEAKIHNKSFLGYDINPVATLIAKTKSNNYILKELKSYFKIIEKEYEAYAPDHSVYESANERLKYWFSINNYIALLRIKHAIEVAIPRGKYRDAFYCLFSSILKASSHWLTKSIKPQVDPEKLDKNPWHLFADQYQKFERAVEQINNCNLLNQRINIFTQNFIAKKSFEPVDLIISSPPYVTSYEYADLHQLSSLWLDYTDDYKTLRKGSIGSVYNSDGFNLQLEELNNCGQRIVQELLGDKQTPSSKVKSVARYYTDMQHTIHNCTKMLRKSGMAFFVVGDTEYKGVKIQNSEHLIECMVNEGFSDIKAAKRTISNKLLTPYRDNAGKFTSDKSSRTIYHEEFLISGRLF